MTFTFASAPSATVARRPDSELSFPNGNGGRAAVRGLDLNPGVRRSRRRGWAVRAERCAARAGCVRARELRYASQLEVKRPRGSVVEHERIVLLHIDQPSSGAK